MEAKTFGDRTFKAGRSRRTEPSYKHFLLSSQKQDPCPGGNAAGGTASRFGPTHVPAAAEETTPVDSFHVGAGLRMILDLKALGPLGLSIGAGLHAIQRGGVDYPPAAPGTAGIAQAPQGTSGATILDVSPWCLKEPLGLLGTALYWEALAWVGGPGRMAPTCQAQAAAHQLTRCSVCVLPW